MSNRFPDATLALGLLPAPAVVKGVSYETIRSERLADFVERMKKGGIDYDVDTLETDPGVILQEEGAYREMLNLAAINDAAKALMILYARETDQDELYALLGIRRLVITPADPTASPPVAAVMEDDDSFLARAQMALDGTAPGLTGGGYASIAMRAAPAVRRVSLVRRPGGVVQVILQGRTSGQGETTITTAADGTVTAFWAAVAASDNDDGSVPAAAVQAVTAALNDDWSDDAGTGSQLTDVPMVQSAIPLGYDVAVRAVVPAGPSRLAIATQSLASLVAQVNSMVLIAGTVPTDALIAAGRLAPMTKLYLDGPAADVVAAPYQVPFCRSIQVIVAYG